MKIKNIPINDRPRERLLEKGPPSLSDEELLTIILGSGNKNKSVKEISNSLLSSIKNISELKNKNYQELTKIEGIGNAKACILLALIEISKRMNQNINSLNNVIFKTPDLIYDFFKEPLAHEMQENFYCIYLDKHKRIISYKLLFKGTLDRSLVHPREIFKEAYLLSASYIVCIHNHPSGDATPSKNDIELTRKIKELGILHGITLMDHIVIGDNNYYSFYEDNNL